MEQKVCPKFKTKFISDQASDSPEIEQLKHWCKIFSQKGLTPVFNGTALGNLGFRVGDGFIITPSGFGLKDGSSADAFVKVVSVDMQNKIVNAHGKREPSSESMLHYAIYEKRKDINAVFHGHSKEILENSQKLKLPTTLKEQPYGTIALVNGVLDVLGSNDFVIMKNHGFISLGKDMELAGQQTLDVLIKITN